MPSSLGLWVQDDEYERMYRAPATERALAAAMPALEARGGCFEDRRGELCTRRDGAHSGGGRAGELEKFIARPG